MVEVHVHQRILSDRSVPDWSTTWGTTAWGCHLERGAAHLHQIQPHPHSLWCNCLSDLLLHWLLAHTTFCFPSGFPRNQTWRWAPIPAVFPMLPLFPGLTQIGSQFKVTFLLWVHLHPSLLAPWKPQCPQDRQVWGSQKTPYSTSFQWAPSPLTLEEARIWASCPMRQINNSKSLN